MRQLSALVIACAIATPTARASLTPYQSGFRTVTAPPIGAGSFGVAGAALADGRLIALTGTEFFVETAAGSGSFTLGATIDASITDGTDPGFLSVSPDGSRIAFGAGFGRPVVVFDSALIDSAAPGTVTLGSADTFAVDHFAATWMNNTDLAITSFGVVTELNTITGDTTTLIDNIGGFSAGVAVDGASRLYTGNGFDNAPGGSTTGTIRSFDPSEWAGGPADFETDGAFFAEALSASPLHVDTLGNLIVAGGDTAGMDAGYVGVLDSAGTVLTQLDPLGTGEAFYSAFVNGATGELIVTADSQWFVYAVPAPGGVWLAALGLASAARRRRHAA